MTSGGSFLGGRGGGIAGNEALSPIEISVDFGVLEEMFGYGLDEQMVE